MQSSPSRSAQKFSADLLAGDARVAAEVLAEEGVLQVVGMFSAEEASELRLHVDGILEESMQAVANGVPYNQLFGKFMCRQHRYDVLLPLDDKILASVQRVLDHTALFLGEAIGEDCSMCELEALVSDPGSDVQPLHHDTKFDGSNPRVIILVALQDVTESMGPTCFFPQTNTPEWHIAYMERGEEMEQLLEASPHILGLMAAGDAFIYDSRVLHFGSANRSHLTEATSVRGDTSHKAGVRRTLLGLSAQVEKGNFKVSNANFKAEYRKQFPIACYRNWST